MTKSYAVTAANSLRPGQMGCFKIGERRIIMARIDNDYYAFDEMCSHEEAELWKGALRKDHIECPLHGGRFCLRTGKPIEEPAATAISTYPVTIKDDILHIEIEN